MQIKKQFIGGPSTKDDLILDAPIDRWDEAIPCGNGLIGALLWGDSSNIKISLDRADLWDLRMPEGYSHKDFNWNTLKQWVAEKNIQKIRDFYNKPYTELPYPTKLPAGRIELDIDGNAEVVSFSLNLKNAISTIKLDKGEIKSFVSAAKQVGMLKITGITAKAKLCPVPFGKKTKGNHGQLSSGGDVGRLGYPQPIIGRSGTLKWYVQKCADGLTYAVVVGFRQNKNDSTEMAFTITSSKDTDDPLVSGKSIIAEALEQGFTKTFNSHKQWWKKFWSKSAIRIPDAKLQQHYYLVQYFYGSASRLGRQPMPLQGVWTADEGTLPPWKGDYHHDLNTQMSYWAYQAANHLDEGKCFLDFLWSLLDKAKKFANDFYGTTGACFPSVMTLDGQSLTGWPQYSLSPTNSAWLAHSFYLHWQYTMDSDFLKNRAYPFCREIAQCLRELLEPDANGCLKLPLSSSPEVHDDELKAWVKPNSNYDLALLKWLFKAVEEMAIKLNYSSDIKWCCSVLLKLENFAVEETSFDESSKPGSLMVSPDESLMFSHRHFSHLMAIYPLGILHVEDTDTERVIIDASLRHLDMLGYGLWVGFSFAWAACMAARCLKPQRAIMMLELFLKGFVSRNGFNLNGDYKKLGVSSWNYRPFTLESNFAAAQAVHEMLLQSWNGAVCIFPAVPSEWSEASFSNLRAQGAFLVSARRSRGHTEWVRIVAEKGGLLVLRDLFAGVKIKWNRNDVKKKGQDYICRLGPGEILETTYFKP